MSETQNGSSLDYHVEVYVYMYLDPIPLMQCVGEL